MKQILRDLAEKLGCRLLGDGSITVTTVSSLQSATNKSLVFVEDAQYLDAAVGSSAAAIIAGEFADKELVAGVTTRSQFLFPLNHALLLPVPRRCYAADHPGAAFIHPSFFLLPLRSATT